MNNSLISQVLTETEIIELGLNNSLMKTCSCPFILNKKYFIKICISYLLIIFLFFSVYITIIILLLNSNKTGLTKPISLIIYIYIFVFFYVDIFISNIIKYDLVKKYNLKEIRKRIYENFLTSQKTDSLKKNKNGKDKKKSENKYKAKNEGEKLFSSEKYYVTNMEENENVSINETKVFEERNYCLDELKNINDFINVELLKYIQYENNNYTINNSKFDIFLTISGLINQLNIFCDLLFLFYLYDFSKNLFIVSLFIYIYYLIHFFVIIKFSIIIIQSLIKIYKKSFSNSLKKTSFYIKDFLSSSYHSVQETLKNFLQTLTLRENHETLNENKSNIFLNKYTNYNSWCFFYKEDYHNDYEIKKFQMKYDSINKYSEKKKKNIIKIKIKKNRNNNKINYEKALMPSYVQFIANTSYFLSFFHILNIMKVKFLSAHNIYSHISFTIVFFVWKLLYMDVVLCLLKFFILFYTDDNLIVAMFLLISIINILNSYLINLLDHNLLNDININ
ncbi:conserved Plasmodium protein, unknown function [Plasmodium gallinaceum]|uniref:Uncharacterized protein n=1 Tax=Plasmodium gallinaceum TaxID=5849 RepID=A0A1J1GWP4_PLAGA|nr:conserved Plasmodium protein, unknown function [Plasmodium gallinaceum]CRG96971.1 conserved Plasmodium protein, unknown function [Plasmodium gallinaceum]